MYVVEAAGRNQYPGHGFPVIIPGVVSSRNERNTWEEIQFLDEQ